ncbi:MAG: class I SAM-dependent methyltransferase [Chloroflexota bacterium]
MAFYDKIAKNWHSTTGFRGGSFKKHQLNAFLLEKIESIEGKFIVDLGAGNGYFANLLFEHFPEQSPISINITDQSARLLQIAQGNFWLEGANYYQLDVRSTFPFSDSTVDLLIATMVFNELTTAGLKRALRECERVLAKEGLLLATITHPEFIARLDRQKLLKKNQDGILTMPGSNQMRLPIVLRNTAVYEKILTKAGFNWVATELFANEQVINEKPALKPHQHKPLAMVFECRKR